jgi:hypothetical protein
MKFSLRHRAGIWNFAGAIALYLVLIPGALALAGVAGWFSWRLGRTEGSILVYQNLLATLLGLEFIIYFAGVVFNPWQGEAFDLRKLRFYPVHLKQFYRLHLVSLLAEPLFLFFLPSQLAILTGLFITIGWRTVYAFVLLILFNMILLCWGSVLVQWATRLLGGRRRKEALVLVLPAAGVLIALIPHWIVRGGFLSGEKSSLILKFFHWLPSGWVAKGFRNLAYFHGFGLEALALLILALLGYYLGKRNLAKWLYSGQGALFSSSSSAGRVKQRAWKLPLVSDAFSALLEKEIKYYFRSSQGRLTFVWPVVYVALCAFLVLPRLQEVGGFEKETAVLALMPFVAFFFMFFLPFYVDLFGYDGQGTKLYYLSPAVFHQVLAAKCLAICWLGFLGLVESALLCLIVFRYLHAGGALMALGSMLAGFTVLLGGGVILSCYFPKPMKIFAVRGNNPPHISVFLALFLMAIASVPGSIAAVVFLLAGWIWGVAVVYAFFIILLCMLILELGPAANLFKSRQEQILQVMTRED